MAYSFPKYKRNAKGVFGPTKRNHWYQASPYHNRTATSRPGKARWCRSEGEQYEVFRLADEPWWWCADSRALYSIIDNARAVLGTNDERMARFRKPTNRTDPWHGHPLLSGDALPGPALLDAWIAAGVITEHVRRKLETRRL